MSNLNERTLPSGVVVVEKATPEPKPTPKGLPQPTTIEERADWVIDHFEQTTMGNPGHRYEDPNHIRGVRVGQIRRLIEQQIREAVTKVILAAEPTAKCPYPKTHHPSCECHGEGGDRQPPQIAQDRSQHRAAELTRPTPPERHCVDPGPSLGMYQPVPVSTSCPSTTSRSDRSASRDRTG